MSAAADWAVALLWRRIECATEQCTETYAGSQRLACAGRELLAELVPTRVGLRDYPADTDDGWRELADAAYEAARSSWLDGGSDDDIHAAAEFAAFLTPIVVGGGAAAVELASIGRAS